MKEDQEKIQGVKALIEKGKKQGVLTYQEIMDTLQGVELTPDQIDEIYEHLASMGIEIASEGQISDVDDKVPEEEVEIDLSVPEGVGIDDPVRMYLKRNRACSVINC